MGNYYYVDEAGDTTIFKRHGTSIIGQPGCSNFFALGFIDVPQSSTISSDLLELRNNLRNDAYLSSCPSMQPEYHKTYDFFHAKDDLPEVRRDVFQLIKKHSEIRFYSIIKHKKMILDEIAAKQIKDPSYRYNPNEVYDDLVKRLFKHKLHKEEQYYVTFAKRGKSDRTDALRQALNKAQKNFDKTWNKKTESALNVMSDIPQNCAQLQVVDYYLWALQRLYEKREDRYYEFLKGSFRLVIDRSNTSNKPYGEYYDDKKPLTLAAVREFDNG